MHELSIAESVLDAVRAESARHGARVVTVGLRIGELSGVNADALRFAMETLEAGIELEIEETGGAELEFAWMEIEDHESSPGKESPE